jgi:cell wall-associated NlpC family hydrolase
MRAPTTMPSTSRVAAADRVIASALELQGTPYRFGGGSPETGFDCSGLIAYVLGLYAIDMPRTVAGQFAFGEPIGRELVRPGDLVFFSTTSRGASHVGLAIDRDGALAFIHAPADGSRVRIEALDSPYWRARWVGARRVLETRDSSN